MTILLVIGMIVVLYILAAEITKRSFYKRVNFKKIPADLFILSIV